MTFLIQSVDFNDADTLLSYYPCLSDFNLDYPEPPIVLGNPQGIRFKERYSYISINSLEELVELMRKTARPLIIGTTDFNDGATADYSIEIYDNYRE